MCRVKFPEGKRISLSKVDYNTKLFGSNYLKKQGLELELEKNHELAWKYQLQLAISFSYLTAVVIIWSALSTILEFQNKINNGTFKFTAIIQTINHMRQST